MPFDIVAWYESQAAAALTAFAAVADDVYQVSSDDIYVKKRAPWLAGTMHLALTTSKYHEYRQPSLKVPYRFYRSYPATSNTYGTSYEHMWARPLPLYPGEKLNAYAQNAATEVNLIAAWLASGPCKRSDVENVKPTHTITGYADQALTAGSWTDCTITWDQDLPKGRYAVVGMYGGTYKSAAGQLALARLKFLDTTWRPGIAVNMMIADKTELYHLGYSWQQGILWPLMPEISFEHDEMPNIEMLCMAANTDHIFQLMLQKIA